MKTNTDELGAQILHSAIYELILKTFEEDTRCRFPVEYDDFLEHSFKAFNDPTVYRIKYNEALRKFLESRGYGSRFYRLHELLMVAVKQENDEFNLALHHLGKLEAKEKLSKENYAKLIKAN